MLSRTHGLRSALPAALALAAALLLPGCGGGGTTVAVFRFAESASSLTEANTAHTVTVELFLKGFGGGPTTIPFTVQVLDAGTGTALASADYTFTAQLVTFPEGQVQPRGVDLFPTRTFTVQILEDTEVESDEQIVLVLSSPSALAGIGPPSTHTITIVDDD